MTVIIVSALTLGLLGLIFGLVLTYAGKKFSVWTLDTEDSIKKAIDMGVDTYFTNDTPLALRLEREYGLEKRMESGESE